jgi:hypothetical protein
MAVAGGRSDGSLPPPEASSSDELRFAGRRAGAAGPCRPVARRAAGGWRLVLAALTVPAARKRLSRVRRAASGPVRTRSCAVVGTVEHLP